MVLRAAAAAITLGRTQLKLLQLKTARIGRCDKPSLNGYYSATTDPICGTCSELSGAAPSRVRSVVIVCTLLAPHLGATVELWEVNRHPIRLIM